MNFLVGLIAQVRRLPHLSIVSFKSKSFGRVGNLGIHLIPQTARLAGTLWIEIQTVLILRCTSTLYAFRSY